VTVDQYLEFADYLGCAPQAPRFDLPVAPFPAPAGNEKRVVVHIGATKPANRWYAPKWAELCRRLVRELGATVHFTGTQRELSEIEALRERSGRRAPVSSCTPDGSR
jgi:heptosyltransferase-1